MKQRKFMRRVDRAYLIEQIRQVRQRVGQDVVTFRVSRRPREMHCGNARLCVCLSVCLSAAARPHYCTDPDVTWESGRGCALVVHYSADLQSVHGLRCYRNTMEMRGRAQR